MGREANAIQAVLEAYRQVQVAAAVCRHWHGLYIREINAEYQRQTANVDAALHKQSGEKARRYEDRLRQADGELQQTLQRDVHATLAQANQHLGLIGASWSSPLWRPYQPPTAPLVVPGGARVGAAALGGPSLPVEAPALAPLVGARSLLLTGLPGKPAAMTELLQSVALRLVATFPPGSLRLSLVDPQGQGTNLADFLRLPEVIRGPKVYASANEVDAELERLARHVENVIQTRLVNTYRTIEEYNGKAGEISVPYHVLLWVNLPAGLTDKGFAHLMDLARNGSRAGTFIIGAIDSQMKWPHSATWDSLSALTTVLAERQPRQMTWNDPVSPWPVMADAKPPKALIDSILDGVGQRAEQRAGVGLPYARVSLDPAQRWSHSSANGLVVPIGVDGSGEVYDLKLGVDLVQHGLIGGKTNSGKTNLLHLMLLGLAERYAPTELELYLVDLKIGVEFKDYQTYDLPHAQVVALESDRELAVSVLAYLQQEMTRRADLFRPEGAKDIAEYRHKTGLPLARILLVMDEYQILFTPDNDAPASEAGRLLVDLVKRARAFGIHVLLSSQSPASAFTNNREALSNMALRVSFQAEDTVARQILGSDNDAARLLERPGESIFNTGNGLPAKNVFVKVALLDHGEQIDRMRQLQSLARGRQVVRGRPMQVFEGDAAVRLLENREFKAGLAQPDWPGRRSVARAWLGEPVEFRPPTRVAIERRVRANVLIAGQNRHAGYALLANALLGLAAERGPQDAAFFVLDLVRRDEVWCQALDEAANSLVHPIHRYEPREAAEMVAELAARLATRADSQASLALPDLYVVIAGLGQFAALGERDKFDNPGPVAKDFIRILTEGPDAGLHTLAWTASYDQLDRMLRRAGLSQFGLRVGLAMSADESNRCLDRPDASRLGNRNRALLRDDTASDDRLEKFKPFDLPTAQDGRDLLAVFGRRAGSP